MTSSWILMASLFLVLAPFHAWMLARAGVARQVVLEAVTASTVAETAAPFPMSADCPPGAAGYWIRRWPCEGRCAEAVPSDCRVFQHVGGRGARTRRSNAWRLVGVDLDAWRFEAATGTRSAVPASHVVGAYTTRFEHDDDLWPTRAVLPRGNEVVYWWHDDLLDVVTRRGRDGEATESPWYDTHTRLLNPRRDAMGYETRWDYDDLGTTGQTVVARFLDTEKEIERWIH